jgi:hypothetical protein
MKMAVLIAACLAALAVPAHAESDAALVQHNNTLDGQCRGGNYGDAATMEACQKRDILTGELFARGYCIGLSATLGKRAGRALDPAWRKGGLPRMRRAPKKRPSSH